MVGDLDMDIQNNNFLSVFFLEKMIQKSQKINFKSKMNLIEKVINCID